MSNDTNVREAVRDRYADAARKAQQSCCSSDCNSEEGDFERDLYPAADLVDVPSGATEASLGCGNPTAVAQLSEGETVLDLGSGAGIDVLLSAKRVGPTGFVYGIDMTDEMLELARKHASEAEASNVEFRKGYIEDIPLGDASVDVVFANMLLPWIDDPAAAFREIARVLGENGLFAFSTLGPDSLLELRDAWRAVDTGVHVRQFADMHDIGDAIVRAGLRDPVLDVDRLSVSYQSRDALFRDITATGARNTLQKRARGLLGRRCVVVSQRVLLVSAALVLGLGLGPRLGLGLRLLACACPGAHNDAARIFQNTAQPD